MFHVFLGRETSIASQGQALEHLPHKIHDSSSMMIFPLRPEYGSFLTKGYSSVSLGAKIEGKVIDMKLNKLISNIYLSVHEMQGSIVKIIILTSAKSQPWSA